MDLYKHWQNDLDINLSFHQPGSIRLIGSENKDRIKEAYMHKGKSDI